MRGLIRYDIHTDSSIFQFVFICVAVSFTEIKEACPSFLEGNKILSKNHLIKPAPPVTSFDNGRRMINSYETD